MEKKTLTEKLASVKTKEDLLAFLNEVKKDLMSDVDSNSSSFYPFTMQHINYYCNPNNVYHRYAQFNIKKKSGGLRQISAPRNGSFKTLLRCLNVIFQAVYTPSDFAMGFTPNRSVVSNASRHIGQNYVFNIDLKDFFPSIDQARVWKRLQLAPFNFTKDIANIVAGMCSMKIKEKSEDGKEKVRYVLPQGAPTSPIITNMICDNLDRRLAGLAKRFGLRYSRYADDITFSSMHNVYQENSEFRVELEKIIEGQHLKINKDKVRLNKKGSRQEVTGLTVGDKVNVTRAYVREIRQLLYIWDKYGILSAEAKFVPKYKEEKGHVKKGNPNLINVLEGKLLYLKMVKGSEDSVFKKLNDKYNLLLTSLHIEETTNKGRVTYRETKSLAQFEKNSDVEVIFAKSDNGHHYAYFQKEGVKHLISVKNDVEETPEKEKLFISSCVDSSNKEFLLIHNDDVKGKVVEVNTAVDVDVLNSELDELISQPNGRED